MFSIYNCWIKHAVVYLIKQFPFNNTATPSDPIIAQSSKSIVSFQSCFKLQMTQIRSLVDVELFQLSFGWRNPIIYHDHVTFMSSLEALQSFDHFWCIENFLIGLLVSLSIEVYVVFFILDQRLQAIIQRIDGFNPWILYRCACVCVADVVCLYNMQFL